MALSFGENGIEFSIDHNSYTLDELEGTMARLRVMLMAGQGYDLIFWDGQPIRTYVTSGFLTDFYTLIDNHPTTTRDDFFTNVLEAYEINGGLFSFPVTFGFEYIGINSNLPQSVLDGFVGRDSITMHELLRVYADLQQNYFEEFGYFQFAVSNLIGMPYEVAAARMADFIDFENNISTLNNAAFIEFLSDFYLVNRGRSIFSLIGWSSDLPRRVNISSFSNDTMFFGANSHGNPMLALFEHIDPYFYNFIPLAAEDGRLLINPVFFSFPDMGVGFGSTWAKLMVSAVGNGQLAWEFIQYLIPSMISRISSSFGAVDSMTFGPHSLVSPITRADFTPHIRSVLNSAAARSHELVPLVGITDGGDRRQAIQEAIDRLAELNERPVTIMEGHNIPSGILADTFNSFLLGLSTPQATAQEIYNRISLWLIE